MVIGDDGDIIRGLGFVTLYSAYFEEEIDRCVEMLRTIDQNLSNLGPSRKSPASKKLKYCLERAKELGVDHLVVVDHAFKGGQILLERRHDVVHGRIYAQDNGLDIRRSGRQGVPDRPITSAELYALVDDFYNAAKMVSQITNFYIPDAIAQNS